MLGFDVIWLYNLYVEYTKNRLKRRQLLLRNYAQRPYVKAGSFFIRPACADRPPLSWYLYGWMSDVILLI